MQTLVAFLRMLVVVMFEILTESLSIRHLVTLYRYKEFLPTCSCLDRDCHHGGVADVATVYQLLTRTVSEVGVFCS